MIHARPDYNRIQDPEFKIGENEPVFLLRAQDISAPDTIRAWVDLNNANGGSLELSEMAEKQALLMEEWQRCHLSKPADY